MLGTTGIYVTIGGVILGVILGGLITWFWSKHYYKKASKDLKEAAKDLRKETEEVKRLTNYMLLGMEKQGWVTLDRDGQLVTLGTLIHTVHCTWHKFFTSLEFRYATSSPVRRPWCPSPYYGAGNQQVSDFKRRRRSVSFS